MQFPLVLCWLEASPPWTASGSHLRGTLKRLAAAGFNPDHVIATTSTGGRVRVLGRIKRISSLVLRASKSVSNRATLLARWHPLLTPVVILWRRSGGRICLLVQGRLDDLYDAHGWTRVVPGFRAFAHYSIKHADSVAVPAVGLRDEVAAIRGESVDEITVLPNGVDIEFFKKMSSVEPATPMEQAYAIFLGNMAGWQGIDTILEAKACGAWPHGVNLVFIGDGVERKRVEQTSDPGVHWLGTLPQSESIGWLNGALVGLAPKKRVAATQNGISPFKIVEYAAAGLPVIASRLPSQEETVVQLGNGLLIEPDSPRQLAEAVRTLYEDREYRARLAASGRSNADGFDWAADASVLAELLLRAETGPNLGCEGLDS